MSDDYDVPSPHEHAVEKKVEEEGGLSAKIALMTAILATIAALISYQSGVSESKAMFLKNESILKQAEASNQWAYYQAKSTKSHIDGSTSDLATDSSVKSRYAASKLKEDQEKLKIQETAQKLQEESKKLSEEAEAKLRPHERLALALTFIQIAITLAAITVLTKKRWLIWGSLGSAAVGIVTSCSVFMMH